MLQNVKTESQKGAAAMEYIIVSLCSLVIAGFSVAFMSKTIKDKIQSMSEKHKIEIDVEEWDSFEP
jgi:Flp pilus assembly pilin Flp